MAPSPSPPIAGPRPSPSLPSHRLITPCCPSSPSLQLKKKVVTTCQKQVADARASCEKEKISLQADVATACDGLQGGQVSANHARMVELEAAVVSEEEWRKAWGAEKKLLNVELAECK